MIPSGRASIDSSGNWLKKTVRVSLAFVSLPKDQLNSLAILLIVCLKNNLLFPNLPITIAAFSALQAAYEDAMSASAIGGHKDSVAFADARDNLVSAMRQIASYIQSLNLTEAQVLTSGFDVVVWSRSKITIIAGIITSLDNSYSGQMGVNLQALAGAKAYHVQYCTGTGAWVDAGIWPNTKGIVILNLTPGTVYGVRVRGVGGSEQYGPWSATTSLMVT
jgi:hypothetical protein